MPEKGTSLPIPNGHDAFDLHVHTVYSVCRLNGNFLWNDGVCRPREVVRRAHLIGLKGLAITDHNTRSGVRSAKSEGKKHDVVVVGGSEIRSIEGMHIVALGAESIIEPFRPLQEIVEDIRNSGGVAVWAHPINLLGAFCLSFGHSEAFDALEINGAKPMFLNRILERNARKRRLKLVGGSDSHNLSTIGDAVTIFREPIDSEEDVIRNIRKGKIESRQYRTSLISRSCVYPQRFRLMGCSYLRKGVKWKMITNRVISGANRLRDNLKM